MTTQAKPKDAKETKPAIIRKTALSLLSERLNVPPDQLKKTLMATVFATCKTDDEFVSAVIVANEYRLNPFTKEIYAFPSKQGGVIPIVSTDGWNKLMTSHPDYKSHRYNFSEQMKTEEGAKPCPEWCECVITKKDGSEICVREYLDEVYRPAFLSNGRVVPGPWQTHTKRMLRHKTKIQTAREAFGFGGIYDEDEGKRIMEAEAHIVPDTPIAAPKSLSGNDARSENHQAQPGNGSAQPSQDQNQAAPVKPKEDTKTHVWSEGLTKFREALGEGEFYSVLNWHNVYKPSDLASPSDEEPIIAEMQRILTARK